MSAIENIEAWAVKDELFSTDWDDRVVAFAKTRGWNELEDMKEWIGLFCGDEIMAAFIEYRNDPRLHELDDDELIRWVAHYVEFHDVLAAEAWIDSYIDQDTAAEQFSDFLYPEVADTSVVNDIGIIENLEKIKEGAVA